MKVPIAYKLPLNCSFLTSTFLTSHDQCVSDEMNYIVAISCVLALTASSNADGSWGGLVYAPGHASADYYAYPRYAFEYAVKDPSTGDNKAQWEKRDGDAVKGAYSLVEPDGSVRIVEYYADDKTGFNAVVKRVGPNLHPATIPAAPIYKAPIPVLREGPSFAPLTIGSVSKLGGLAGAPLISGPLYGGAVSSSILNKVATVAIAPAPILPTPILPSPIIKSAPLLPSAAIYDVPYLPSPLYKSGLILSQPLPPPAFSAPQPLLKAPLGFSGIGGWGNDLGLGLKGGLPAAGYLGDLGSGLLKQPLLPSWGSSWGGLMDYPYLGGMKH